MDQIRVMANEWLKALRAFGAQTVHRATTKCIQESKWWPALAEVVALCRADEDGWRDALGLKDERRYIAEPDTFARDGRTEAEEIAHRIATVKAMKAEAGFGTSEEIIGEARAPAAPASQDMRVSDALRNTKLVRELLEKQRHDVESGRVPESSASDTTTIDSQSPPTASESFDDTQHGRD